jgi:type I restriction enzyme M protein
MIPDATFFVRRLTEAVDTLWPSLERSLRTTMARDPKFKKQLRAWATRQGIANFGDDPFYETVARQVVYRLLGKVLFYQSLRRQYLSLPPLDLSDVSAALVMPRLRDLFAQACRIDYQAVFEESIVEHVPFPQAALDELVALTADLERGDFAEMPQDVVGRVFEGLIPPEERRALEQYFTREDLVDLILAFCVRTPTDNVLDPTCGTGTFLLRTYDRLKHLGQSAHHRLLAQLWGVDIAHFPAELATINLFRQDLSDPDNFPRILVRDFFEITPDATFRFPPPRTGDEFGEFIEEPMPVFDAVVGNFPYIRQERIERQVKGYKRQLWRVIAEDWLTEYEGAFDFKKRVAKELKQAQRNGLALAPFYEKAELRLSGLADIYAYLFFHAAHFLREGGRMGIVTSNAWLDVAYGYELQRFFLNNFKIVVILESRCEPWFEEAAVNTVVTVLECCRDAEARDANPVRFVKVKRPLPELSPADLTAGERWEDLEDLVELICEAMAGEWFHGEEMRVYEDEDVRVRAVRQGALREEVEAAGKTVKWGPYLRAPDVYFDILRQAGDKLTLLRDVAPPARGGTTRINEFFYVDEETIQRWDIDPEFCWPLIKSPSETDTIRINPDDLGLKVFVCRNTKDELRTEGKLGTLRYIEWGEQQEYKRGVQQGMKWPTGPWVRNRQPGWYALPKSETHFSQLFFTKAFGDRHITRYSPQPLVADCRLYFLQPESSLRAEETAAVLNSSIGILFAEVTGRVTLGDGALELAVEDARDYLRVPDVRRFSEEQRECILAAFEPLLERPIGSVFSEVTRSDRQALDRALLEALGLNPEKYLPRIYEGLTTLVRERIELGRMRNRRKKERVRRDVASLEQQVLAEVLPQGPRRFPDAFLPKEARQGTFKTFALPQEPLQMGLPHFGKVALTTSEEAVIFEGTKPEAKFVLYTRMAGQFIVQMPQEPIHVYKTVAAYEVYLRKLRQQLYAAFYSRALDHAVAERLTEKTWQGLGLPEIEGA